MHCTGITPMSSQYPAIAIATSSFSPLLLYCSGGGSPTWTSPKYANKKEAVYVAAFPLRATPGPAQWLLSTAYRYQYLRHYLVLVESSPKVIFAFDFQPKDPQNILSALAVITNTKLPGVILQREIQRIPTTSCWFVGFSKGNALEIANIFNQNWSTDLVVGTNDCRHYTNGLVECLTGEENVLESLKQTFR